MYAVFIVFANGHCIKLETFEFKENAILQAKYHKQWCNESAVKFEVYSNGELQFKV